MKPPTDEQIRRAREEAGPLPFWYWVVCAIAGAATLVASIYGPAGLVVLP